MTPPTIPPTVDERWQAFITTVPSPGPHRTITPLDLRASNAAGLNAPVDPHLDTAMWMATSPSPSVPKTELPIISTDSAPGSGGDYEVTGVLGEGGMGRVVLARQRSLQRDVALKTLKTSASGHEMAEALLTEAIVTGSIEHPNIVPIHALGRDTEGRPVFVMKRVEGVSWANLVADSAHPAWTSISPDAADRLDSHIEILLAVCNAVHYAHCRGIVHRDIKLENVMIGGFGEVYLVDWGIAMRIRPADGQGDMYGPPVGTLGYMAPEMAVGDMARIDARTDVYLLGATLHALLTGAPRHLGDAIYDMLDSARESKPFEYGPGISAELVTICHKAMHVDPDQRFSSALEFRQALVAFRRHRGSITLSERARARLDEVDVHRKRRATNTAMPEDDRRVHTWLTEARFGFMQALEAWKGNEAAQKGLDLCLERMVEHEIEQRDLEGARSLLAEFSAPRPELEKRVEALATELSEARAREERLRALERDADLSIGAKRQAVLLGVFPLYAMLAIAVVRARNMRNELTLAHLLAFPIITLALGLALWFFLRLRLTTAVSRRAFRLMLFFPLATLVHRVLALFHHASITLVLTTDMIIMAVIAGTFGVAILPRAGWGAGILLAGAIVASLFPAYAMLTFAICIGATATFLAATWAGLIRWSD
ncbi:MAG TPA: protein kinase [Polyangium sp.]|nr:protein kinase [Polyangium sp.]